MSLHLYFIRHGLKDTTMIDPDLTETGHVQAQKTAHYLQQFPITKLIVSPFLRTQQTAIYISKSHSLPIITDERLKERIYFSNFDGKKN